MNNLQHPIIKLTLLTFLLLITYSKTTAQSNTIDLEKRFYKSKHIFEKDATTYKLFKKSRNRKITATALGSISIASIVGGTLYYTQFEPTGQSVDVAAVLALFGVYSIGILSGITALIFNQSAKNKKKAAIYLYQEKYGTSFIPKSIPNESYSLKVSVNGNGLGLIFNF